MKIILFQPQIPQNTGNIVRTCSATNTELILVRPLGFSTQSRHLKRAGLDYWDGVTVSEIDNLDEYLQQTSAPFYFFSSHAKTSYTKTKYSLDSILIFGSETHGLSPIFWEKWEDRFRTIPMIENKRCLNLSSSAAIVLYEALRQNHFRFGNNKEKKTESTALNKTEDMTGA
jgi:tRNA (cytidine/uridine-2'-O-)-methyltransferase